MEKFEVASRRSQDSFAFGSRWRTLGIRSSFDRGRQEFVEKIHLTVLGLFGTGMLQPSLPFSGHELRVDLVDGLHRPSGPRFLHELYAFRFVKDLRSPLTAALEKGHEQAGGVGF